MLSRPFVITVSNDLHDTKRRKHSNFDYNDLYRGIYLNRYYHILWYKNNTQVRKFVPQYDL